MNLPPVQLDFIALRGGLDQITPTLNLPNGYARYALNFECAVTGGYTRISGYERFDGRTSPSDSPDLGTNIYTEVVSFSSIPSIGDTVTTSGGATGVVARIYGNVMLVCKTTGTWVDGETVFVGATEIGILASVDGGPADPEDMAMSRNAIADIYRASITAVPGSGNVLGVVEFKDNVYAFRNAANGLSCKMYKASPSGWSEVTTGVTLSPGGRYEFIEFNFYGQSASNMLYGVDGVNKAFQYDGTTFTQISTGATTDTPTHIVVHHNYLFLSIGSSAMYSAPGTPTDFTAISGAGEIATGDTITGMISASGNASALTITSRNNTLILNGTSPADWSLVSYNTGTGALPYSMQNMAQTFAFDDRGVISLQQTAASFADFNSSSLSNAVLPFVNERMNLLTASTLNRRKSQYRLFFSDGFGLYITVVNGKLSGCMPVYFPNDVTCAYEGKTSSGVDVNYFGSSNGFVYQLDKGTSFDGAAIDFQLQLNYANAKGPRTLKRFRKATLELSSDLPAFAAFSFGFLLGYDSAEYSQTDSTSYAQYLSPASRWDVFKWDNFFWDSSGLEPTECELSGTAENMAILIFGSYDYIAPFTINSALIHYSPRRMMR